MDKTYEPRQVYRLRRNGAGVRLGELVDHRWADETPGVEQACVYVALVNSGGEIYIQHRARTKRLWPDHKTISASGHVDPGETFEQAAVREVAEELGLEVSASELRRLGSFAGLAHCGPVYEVHSDQSVTPAPGELDMRRSGFVSVPQLKNWLSEPDSFTPSGARALGIWLAGRQ